MCLGRQAATQLTLVQPRKNDRVRVLRGESFVGRTASLIGLDGPDAILRFAQEDASSNDVSILQLSNLGVLAAGA